MRRADFFPVEPHPLNDVLGEPTEPASVARDLRTENAALRRAVRALCYRAYRAECGALKSVSMPAPPDTFRVWAGRSESGIVALTFEDGS